MHKDDRHYILALRNISRNTVEILALAFVLTFGINLVSTALPTEFSLSSRSIGVLGLILIFVSVAYLVHRFRSVTARELILRGVLALGEKRIPAEIDRYELSERLNGYFRGISAENKAIAKLWMDSPIGLDFDEKNRLARGMHSQANLLVLEALEYFVLDKLSMHLGDYFDSERNIDETTVMRFERNDIPQVLLQNRFLEIFSKPMEMREAFMDHFTDHGPGKIVYAMGKDGALFEHFELVLPSKSQVTRLPGSGLSIQTSRFHLTVKPEFIGTAAVLPNQFEELYLGLSYDDLAVYGVSLRVKVEFKWWSLLTGRGWDYYEWLDSFLDELAATFDFDNFLSKIHWEAAASVAIVLQHQKRSIIHSASKLSDAPD